VCRHVEELVRLPESFLCYTPSPEAGPVCPTPAISNGFVTFGSFNNLAKVHDRFECFNFLNWITLFIELFFFGRLHLKCCKFGPEYYAQSLTRGLWLSANHSAVTVSDRNF
jgi:hypothetical protein